MNKKLTIEICMGSSCYSRGNSETLALIEKFCKEEAAESAIALKGSLCMNACAKGPTIIINGDTYNGVHPNCITDLLRFHLERA